MLYIFGLTSYLEDRRGARPGSSLPWHSLVPFRFVVVYVPGLYLAFSLLFSGLYSGFLSPEIQVIILVQIIAVELLIVLALNL